MPVKDLSRLVDRFVANAASSEGYFEAGDMGTRAFAALTLYAKWEEFNHRLIYLSACGRPLAADGRYIPRAPGMRNHRDVELALRSWKRRQPGQKLVLHLGAPRVMVEACKQLALANEPVITPAILSQNSPANELRLIRNFLAHQNASTATQMRNLALQNFTNVPGVLLWLAQRQSGGRTRFGVWGADLSAVARACAN